jgi:hypothetical protein
MARQRRPAVARAPWILDFNIDEDQVTQIDVAGLDDATPSLNADYIETIDIVGGSALIHDDPVDNSLAAVPAALGRAVHIPAAHRASIPYNRMMDGFTRSRGTATGGGWTGNISASSLIRLSS